MERAVSRAFNERPGLVDGVDGFLGLEVFTAADDPSEFHLVTRWTDVATFERWHHGPLHREAHAGIPRGLKLDPSRTHLQVLDRFEPTDDSPRAALTDSLSLLGVFLGSAQGVHLLVTAPDGAIRQCNPAAAAARGISSEAARSTSLWDWIHAVDHERLRAFVAAGERRPGVRLSLNFVDVQDQPYTLECHVDVQPDAIRIVGERSWVQSERFERELTYSNNELARVSRESVQRAHRLSQALEALQQAKAQIEEMARHDPLSQVGNRLAFEERAALEWARAGRHGHPLSLLMLDLDHFKSINDTWGHAAGDRTLIAVSKALCSQKRSSDLVARFGGEEFVVLMPDTDADGARCAAERLRAAIGGLVDCPRPITASFGVATVRAGDDFAATLARADSALYRAKQGGRDRVEIAE